MEKQDSTVSCSYFISNKDKKPVAISTNQIYNMLVSERFKENTEKYRYFRAQGLTKEAASVKGASACVTFSAVCKDGHAAKNIVTYNGGQMADFDYIPAEEIPALMALLANDPYVYIAHTTISGKGIHIFCRTDVTDVRFHKLAYTRVNEYFARLLGKKYDPQCKDCTRPAYLCYAPDAVYHPDARVMHIDTEEAQAEAKKSAGRPRKVHHATASTAAPAVTSALQQQGKEYVEGHYNEYVSSAFYLMNAFGVQQDDALQWAATEFPDYEAGQLESIIRSVYQNTDEHGQRKLPAKKKDATFRYADLEELEVFIGSQASIRNNVILARREICWTDNKKFTDLSDSHENTLWLRAKKAGLHSPQNTFRSILRSEFVPDFNPFVHYFDTLPPWDGTTDHIARVAAMIHTSAPLFEERFRKWIVAFVAGLLNPDVVNQLILTLIGRQGIYKTTFFNKLLPTELQRYFYTKINSGIITKDDKLVLSEYALVCIEEIDAMKPSELNQLKAMTGMKETHERAAFERNKTCRPHIASFCATGNNRFFLTDDTGNRRWYPVIVDGIDDPYTTPIPYAGLYAQALSLYRSGFHYWFTLKEIKELDKHNKEFESPNIEEELICSRFRRPMRGEAGMFMSTAEILERIGASIRYNLSRTKTINAMNKLGYESMRCKNQRGFRIVLLTAEELHGRKADENVSSDNANNQQLSF